MRGHRQFRHAPPIVGVVDFWEGFTHDPRLPAHASLRATDADRERIQGLLADAYADGRLSAPEHEERLTAAVGARTLGDLPPLAVDLIGPASREVVATTRHELRARASREQLRQVLEVAGGSATPFVICLIVWAFTGDGIDDFWPKWALIPVLIAVVPMVLSSPARIGRRVEELEARARAADENRS